jgi:hypothetical protein
MRGHCGRTRPPGWPHRRRGPSPHLAAVGFALDGAAELAATVRRPGRVREAIRRAGHLGAVAVQARTAPRAVARVPADPRAALRARGRTIRTARIIRRAAFRPERTGW